MIQKRMFPAILAAGMMLCSTLTGWSMPMESPALLTARAVESGCVGSGTTAEGFNYDVYGSYEWIYDEETGEDKMEIYSKAYTVITGYESSAPVAKIPAEAGGAAVTTIGRFAFFGNEIVTSVVIPDTVTMIESESFCSCANLTKVTIPASTATIGDNAFQDCQSLTSAKIPDGVLSIGEYAFASCTSLTSAIIPDTVMSIGTGAFYGCTSLTKVQFPSELTALSDNVLDSCSSLTSVTIPDGVLTIKSCAFANCTSLVDVSIPDSVTVIGDYAFANCPSITEITLPPDLTSIPVEMFGGCTSLTSIDIPDGVTTINEGAFQYCTALNKIDFPEKLSVIGAHAFMHTGFSEITIPEGVKAINEGTFQGVSLTSVTIPSTVEKIYHHAFADCETLKSPIIPATVKVIEEEAFGYWTDWVYSYPYEDFSISGYPDTAAEKYANDNGFTFIDLSKQPATEPPTTTEPPTVATVYGDVNCDGEVDLLDVLTLNRNLLIGEKLTDEGVANADVDLDKKPTSVDALNILKFTIGIVKELPV